MHCSIPYLYINPNAFFAVALSKFTLATEKICILLNLLSKPVSPSLTFIMEGNHGSCCTLQWLGLYLQLRQLNFLMSCLCGDIFCLWFFFTFVHLFLFINNLTDFPPLLELVTYYIGTMFWHGKTITLPWEIC